MEMMTEELFAEKGLVELLLDRFENGLLYSFLPGHIYTANDLAKESVQGAITACLGESYAKLPLRSTNSVGYFKSDVSDIRKHNDLVATHFRSPRICTFL